MIHVQAELFGTLALIPLALSLYAVWRRHLPAVAPLATSVMILAIWAVTTQLERSFAPPQAYFFHWCLDLVAMLACAWLAKKQKLKFALLLAVLYGAQVVANAAYLIAAAVGNVPISNIPHSANIVDPTTYRYKFLINLIFLMQLAASGLVGGMYVASDLRAWWRRRSWFRSHVDARR